MDFEGEETSSLFRLGRISIVIIQIRSVIHNDLTHLTLRKNSSMNERKTKVNEQRSGRVRYKLLMVEVLTEKEEEKKSIERLFLVWIPEDHFLPSSLLEFALSLS